jgi:murein DD-endopeptidase MepM/ murein hydrolase activator NlpD
MRPASLFVSGVAVGMAATLGIIAWKSLTDVSFAGRPATASGPTPGGADVARPDAATAADVRRASPEAPSRSPAPPVPADASDVELLRSRGLLFPVPGVDRASLRDDFTEERSRGRHEALDILAPRDTPVLAVDDGRVAKLFNSVRGGLTVYQFEPAEAYCYYYAHLDRYADGLAEGNPVHRGEVLGYVGTTGNAPPQTPHLHFAIFKLGPEKRWWEGVAIDPFPLWVPEGRTPTH